jgi:hypothetical protein
MAALLLALACTLLGLLLLSILLAVLTVSPNRQKRGILLPTTPDMTGPEFMPMRSCSGSPVGSLMLEATLSMACEVGTAG